MKLCNYYQTFKQSFIHKGLVKSFKFTLSFKKFSYFTLKCFEIYKYLNRHYVFDSSIIYYEMHFIYFILLDKVSPFWHFLIYNTNFFNN